MREERVLEVVSKPASRKTMDWPVIWPVVRAGNSPDNGSSVVMTQRKMKKKAKMW